MLTLQQAQGPLSQVTFPKLCAPSAKPVIVLNAINFNSYFNQIIIFWKIQAQVSDVLPCVVLRNRFATSMKTEGQL